MAIWDDIAQLFGGGVDYTYPDSVKAINRQPFGASPLAQFAGQPQQPQQAQPSALAQLVPQQQEIPKPYNALERAFLGFGGQGAAVDADLERYNSATSLQESTVNGKFDTNKYLQSLAAKDPKYIPSLIANSQKPETTYEITKDAAGNPIAVDKRDPTKMVRIGGAGSALPDVKGEGELRKEFDSLNKNYRDTNDAYNKIKKVEKDPSAAGDISLIFSYMKMLDPSSTVREGEFATAQNATGVPAQVQNMWNKALTGERLPPTQRADFLRQSKNIYDAQSQSYSAGIEKYRGLAKDYGYNPDRIVKPIAVEKTLVKQQKNPKTGQIRNVYSDGTMEVVK